MIFKRAQNNETQIVLDRSYNFAFTVLKLLYEFEIVFSGIYDVAMRQFFFFHKFTVVSVFSRVFHLNDIFAFPTQFSLPFKYVQALNT